MDKLKHVEEMKGSEANEAVQIAERMVYSEEEKERASAAQQVQEESTGVTEGMGGTCDRG